MLIGFMVWESVAAVLFIVALIWLLGKGGVLLSGRNAVLEKEHLKPYGLGMFVLSVVQAISGIPFLLGNIKEIFGVWLAAYLIAFFGILAATIWQANKRQTVRTSVKCLGVTALFVMLISSAVVFSNLFNSNGNLAGTNFVTRFAWEINERNLSGENRILLNSPSEAIAANFTNVGRDRHMRLIVFYDYTQVDFSVNGGEFSNKYDFSIQDNEMQEINVVLGDKIANDNNVHKVMFSLIASYDVNAYTIEGDARDSSYGITTLFDLAYVSDATVNFQEQEDVLDAAYFDFRSEHLVFNSDYGNEFQKKESLKYPGKLMSVRQGSATELMCNVTGEFDGTGLVLLTLNNEQIKIDGRGYKVVELKKDKVANGVISFDAPAEPGIYEVIGYIVGAPFDEDSNGDYRYVYTSIRFTLEVKE